MLGSSDKDTTPPLGSVILPVWKKIDSQIVNYLRGKLGKQCLQGRARFQLHQEMKGTIREVGGHRGFIDD